MTYNLNALRRFIAARRGGDSPEALSDWRAPELFSLSWMLSRRLARGALLRARLGEAAGLVFCERGVRVSHAHHVRAGRDLNLEEGCSIMGLSKRGIVFGERCTVGRGAMITPTGVFGGEPGEGFRLGDNSNVGHYRHHRLFGIHRGRRARPHGPARVPSGREPQSRRSRTPYQRAGRHPPRHHC